MTESLTEIHKFLEAVAERPNSPTSAIIRQKISEQKAFAVTAGNEQQAKTLWCLEETLEAQDLYLQAFAELTSHDFYRAWCNLEKAEIALHALAPHELEPPNRFRTDFIRNYVPKWQSLFPYKLFFSPEWLHLEKKCSICGAVVKPRTPCGHRPGEIYGGQLCLRVITDGQVLGVAYVENPVQKYSVLFMNDPMILKPGEIKTTTTTRRCGTLQTG
jgi:hypothetical protein